MCTTFRKGLDSMKLCFSKVKPKAYWTILLLQLSILPTILLSTASANMVLSEAIVHFEPGKPLRKDIEVTNPGDENLYVEIEPKLVLNPGTKDETRQAFSDPREGGLLVTPNKLVIPPGGRKLVRVVSLKPAGAEERVYRVTFKPVVGELENEQIGVKILIGYEVLILMQPAKPDSTLATERNGSTISFTNQGNTNVLLREGKQCPNNASSDSEECESLRGKRLYPGNQYSVELPYKSRPVEYQMSIGTKNLVKTYK